MVMCTFPMVLLSHAIPYPIPDTSHGYKSRAESPQITCKGKTTTTLAQPCQRQNAGSTHRWLSSFTSRLTTKRRKKIPWNSLPCFPQHTTARLLRLRRCLSTSSPKKVWETVLIFSSACFFFFYCTLPSHSDNVKIVSLTMFSSVVASRHQGETSKLESGRRRSALMVHGKTGRSSNRSIYFGCLPKGLYIEPDNVEIG